MQQHDSKIIIFTVTVTRYGRYITKDQGFCVIPLSEITVSSITQNDLYHFVHFTI
jgi:hypothetical protein